MRLEGKERPEYLDKDGYMVSDYREVITSMADSKAFCETSPISMLTMLELDSYKKGMWSCDLFFSDWPVRAIYPNIHGEDWVPDFVYLNMENPIVKKEIEYYYSYKEYIERQWKTMLQHPPIQPR